MSQHIIPPRTYFIIFGVLMGLLIATVAGAYAPLGHFHLAFALLIAGAKAEVIVLYFMHVRYSSRLTMLFSSAALLWLVILIGLSISDYYSRGWLNIEGK
jgi:cytochrome c oxidase subunit 4